MPNESTSATIKRGHDVDVFNISLFSRNTTTLKRKGKRPGTTVTPAPYKSGGN